MIARRKPDEFGRRPLLAGMLVFAFAAALVGSPGGEASAREGPGDKKKDPNVVEIVFTYGSEKKEWINDVTKAFNADPGQQVDGKRIKVLAVPLGSGESVEELLEGREPEDRPRAHVTSPASSAYVELGNAESLKRTKKPLLGPTKNLVLSPVVIAMWKPMAEALGWPEKPIGWADILELARNEKAWKDRGKPQWDPFQFGHTHPELSNSGLITVNAIVYASRAARANKEGGLTLADVRDPETGRFMRSIEQAVVYYGTSTGFFGEKMFKGGPAYLSAAVMYENMVIESYDRAKYPAPEFPVVAIYPKEGTFISDHPIGVVERDWVGKEEREAAKKYIDFLREEGQQRKALQYGFRPALETVRRGAPLDRDHGVDPAQPRKELEVPSADVMAAVLDLWKENRKPSSHILVMDTSGSMSLPGRMTKAKEGAKDYLTKFGPRDYLSVIPFSDTVAPPEGRLRLAANQDKLKSEKFIDELVANGQTALFDAVREAYRLAQEDSQKKMLPSVIVLTDGLNNRSKGRKVESWDEHGAALNELLKEITPAPEKWPTRVFTIGYALNPKEPEEERALADLKKIAKATGGEFYQTDPKTIEKVLRAIRSSGH